MAISRVGFTKALGNTIAWPSGHAQRDLAIVFAHATGSTTPITPPAGWYTQGSASNIQSRGIFYCWADSSAMPSATFANSEFLHMWVGRGDVGLLVPGNLSQLATVSTTIWGYLGFTPANFDATSIILASACSAATDNTAYTTAPTGMTNLDSQLDLATQIGASNLHESGLRNTWGTVNVTGSGTANAIGRLLTEVYEMPATFGSGGSGFRPVNIRGGADQ